MPLYPVRIGILTFGAFLLALALFDLDNTLLAGDSDYEWGQYLVKHNIVDAQAYEEANGRFYDEYKQGTLDIFEFVRFAFRPLSQHPMERLESWRESFYEEHIKPIMLQAGQERINWHKERGDLPVIITATNSFVTSPIAQGFGVDVLIATEPEIIDGQYTGELSGTPCFQAGKVSRLQEWMSANDHSLENSWFYSDSHNDLPLLEQVSNPVAVDADDQLVQTAQRNQWDIVSFRGQ